MSLTLTTAPSEEPVELEEVKALQPKVDTDDDDAMLTRLIRAARAHVENVCWRQLITATYTLKLRGFPRGPGIFDGGMRGDQFSEARPWHLLGHVGRIFLPRPPLQSVTSVHYIDQNGNAQTLDPAAYQVDADSEPGSIEPAYGTSWPLTRDVAGAVTVVYVAGYGDDAESVPEPIRDGIIRWVRQAYDFGSSFSPRDLPVTLTAFLSDYKFRDGRVLEGLR